MNAQQQTALENLISRPLSASEIAEIDNVLAIRNDVAIAQVLSAGRTKVQTRQVGIGTILATMAPNGGDFLNTLETLGATDANVKWALKLIEKGEFDVGLEATRSQLSAYAQAMPALADGINALLALAEVADPIHYNSVSDALNGVA